MNINNSINQYSNYANNITTTGTQKLTDGTVSALKEGQVFEGSINSIDDKGRVVIGMSDGSTLNARLASGVSITEGQSLFFQVKSNDGALIQIKPVSLDIDTNPTLLKALDSANIMATEKTVAMVNLMMNESMPINSESLAAMNRIMLSNPGINPETVVMMTKYNLPVTTSNANIFEAYANDTAQITNNVNKISEDLSLILNDESVSIGNKISFTTEINNIFNGSVNIDGNFYNKSVAEAGIVPKEIVNAQESVDNFATETNANTVFGNTKNQTDETIKESLQLVNKENQAFTESEENDNSSNFVNNVLPTKQIVSLQNILETFPNFSNVNEKLFATDGSIKPNITVNELFSSITEYLNSNPDVPKESIKDLFHDNGFKSLINGLITNNFSISPEEITKPGSISKLYERVVKLTDQLYQAAEKLDSKFTDNLRQSTNELKNNVNFMNSANEIYNFVQIPLKMFEQNSQSMLYVRQNKSKAYANGEEITAFLHFDLKYLGSTDIFIKLKQRDVSCDWTLENEKSLELIEANMDILNQRLMEKGYNCNMKCSTGGEDFDFVKDFLRVNEPAKDGIVHRYSFDMRA